MRTDSFQCRLTVQPIWWDRAPRVLISLDDVVIWQGCLQDTLDLEIDRPLTRGRHHIDIKFSGKQNSDCQHGKDQAVVIDSIDFFGIKHDKFKWQGKYQPEYPEPWRSQQQALGVILPDCLDGHDYLGWNGVWSLEFSTPIFTWMHGVLDLGWIYA